MFAPPEGFHKRTPQSRIADVAIGTSGDGCQTEDAGDRQFTIEDPKAAKFPNYFYRVVSAP